jgi:hypothetical protein
MSERFCDIASTEPLPRWERAVPAFLTPAQNSLVLLTHVLPLSETLRPSI